VIVHFLRNMPRDRSMTLSGRCTGPRGDPMPTVDARVPMRLCPRLYARWLASAERAAWITRSTRLVPPGGVGDRALDPRASHVPPMWAALAGRLGPDAEHWPLHAIREGVRVYLARHGPPAVVEVAEWWRFMARTRRRPAWVRLAVCIEIDRWMTP